MLGVAIWLARGQLRNKKLRLKAQDLGLISSLLALLKTEHRLVFQSPWEFSVIVDPQLVSCHPAPLNSPQSKASGPSHFTEGTRFLRHDTFPQIAPAPIIFLFPACHLWPCSREISLHGEGGIRSSKLLIDMRHTCILAPLPTSHLLPKKGNILCQISSQNPVQKQSLCPLASCPSEVLDTSHENKNKPIGLGAQRISFGQERIETERERTHGRRSTAKRQEAVVA